ncbi:MAG: thiamine pyrophosphate-dependent enzyme [Candidatus Bathyarchaeota archaeon]|nr:thiamine pyrophosphate-dependent enzyme [Candidatus Bathyarchaeota archaeon]MDH5792571.1 thiamine pyrophosphate-dependent enzyme [Candidatus Bathyarchaeota archaeon]
MSKPFPLTRLGDEEFIDPANQACQGCAGSIVARIVSKALGPNIVRQEVACCGPAFGNIRAPSIYAEVFEGAGAMMTGLTRGFKRRGREDITVVGIIGDGGTVDIGFQGLSAAAERNEDFIWVVYDNEAYMNTGGQRSSATTKYAYTTTTPVGELSRGKPERKKNVPLLVAAHNVPYVATASVSFPEDLIGKLQYAQGLEGFRFIHISAPCPTGWGFNPMDTIKVGREMVLSGLWPLYEVVDGRTLRLTYKPRELKPVREVLKMQGRFRHVTDPEVEEIQGDVTEFWERLTSKDGGPLF